MLDTSPVGVSLVNGIYIPSLKIFYLQGQGSSISNVWVSSTHGVTWEPHSDSDMNGSRAFIDAETVNQMLAFGNELLFVAHFSSVTTDLHLSKVVREICQRAALDEDEYTTSGLNDLVYGIVFADDYTCADAIRTLMSVYQFDSSEHDAGSGYKLHFPKRGRDAVLTLTIDDFVDIPDKTTRQDAYERPRVLHMAYQSPIVGYAPAKASPTRFSPDLKVVGELSAQVPVSFIDSAEPWYRADVMLKVMWTTVGGEEEFTLPESFLRLIPSDAIGVSLRGQTRRMLITEQRYENGTLVCKLVADRQSNYTSNISAVPLPPPTPPPPSVVSSTLHLPLDIPALNDNNDRLLSYHAATGLTSIWPGALVELSVNGGVSYNDLVRFSQNSIIGVLQNEVSAASPHYTDRTNILRIQLMSDDTVEALTEQEFLSEGGSIAVSFTTSEGRFWEVMQYRDVEEDSDGIWNLSHLLRGRLNTEGTAHTVADYVVFLDTVQSANNVTSQLGVDLTYRATSVSRSPDTAPVYTEEYTGNSQREWPVAHILMERAGSTVNGRIVPRHRFGTELNPVRSINWSGYAISIRDATDQIFGFDSLSDTFTYDASGMTFPLDVTVRQINRLTGTGEPVTETIE